MSTTESLLTNQQTIQRANQPPWWHLAILIPVAAIASTVPWFGIGFGLYGVNLIIGVLAQTRQMHFGVWHHVLYFIVFWAAALATLFTWNAFLLLTIAALAVMPKSKPGTWRHPLIALIGLCGYLLAFFF